MSRSGCFLTLQLWLFLLLLVSVFAKLEPARSSNANKSRNHKSDVDFLRHLQGKQLGECQGDCDSDSDVSRKQAMLFTLCLALLIQNFSGIIILIFSFILSTLTFFIYYLSLYLSISKCADSRVCYHRKSNTNVPTCCQNKGLSTKDSTDYCVSAGCAAYTDDAIVDDDPFSGLDDDFWDNVVQDDNFDGLGVCQGSCHDDDDVSRAIF